MTDDRQIRDDLSYVRGVVRRSERVDNPASIYFLWAAISFFGYAIIDFQPDKTGVYWAFAGPIGGFLSAVLGSRAARRLGQVSDRKGWVEALHWTGMMFAAFLLIPLVTTGRLATADIPRVILLILALTYWSAGLRDDRRFLPLGAVMAAMYLFTIYAARVPYLWTITAAVLAMSLATAGILGAARGRRVAG
jgi:hypothetical protein